MILSKERLVKEQKATGYRQEMIEKVVWLISILNSIADDSFLKAKFVLKGGTALNLFHFDLPRLSVDADLNYIGGVEREIMLKERPEIELRVQQLMQGLGLTLSRNPQVHAGGKMTWRYPSALGMQGNVEIDLNFMYRVPLLPIKKRNSVTLANQEVSQMPLLDFHELAAGKLTALLDRGAGRDIFDAYHLFRYQNLEIEKLRLCFVIYTAMSHKRDFLKIDTNQIDVDREDLKNKLIPVLKQNFNQDFSSMAAWTDHLLEEVKIGYKKLLPFNENEKLFINNIRDKKSIEPELLISDKEVISKVKAHPALLWAVKRGLAYD
jgi:predicted nucleotidyltransferase component of viral defense system